MYKIIEKFFYRVLPHKSNILFSSKFYEKDIDMDTLVPSDEEPTEVEYLRSISSGEYNNINRSPIALSFILNNIFSKSWFNPAILNIEDGLKDWPIFSACKRLYFESMSPRVLAKLKKELIRWANIEAQKDGGSFSADDWIVNQNASPFISMDSDIIGDPSIHSSDAAIRLDAVFSYDKFRIGNLLPDYRKHELWKKMCDCDGKSYSKMSPTLLNELYEECLQWAKQEDVMFSPKEFPLPISMHDSMNIIDELPSISDGKSTENKNEISSLDSLEDIPMQEQETSNKTESHQQRITRDINELLSAKEGSTSYIASADLPFDSHYFLHGITSALRDLQDKINALDDSRKNGISEHLENIRKQIMRNTMFLLGGKVIPLDSLPEKAALGVTLLNAAYHEQKASEFSSEVRRLNKILSNWKDDVYLSRIAHKINYDAVQQMQSIIMSAIENDPRLEKPVSEMLSVVRINKNIIESTGWKTLRDVARKNTKEIMAIPGIGSITYGKIRKYFNNKNLPHLLLVEKESANYYNYYNFYDYIKNNIFTKYSWEIPDYYSSTGKAKARLCFSNEYRSNIAVEDSPEEGSNN